MKLPLIAAALTTLALTSCTSDSTQYNGYILNNTGDKVTANVAGGDNLLRTEVEIENGDSAKIFYANEDGDNELFDCVEIADSVWYNANNTSVTLRSSDIVIDHNSELGGDGTRIHHCTIEIK